MRIEIVEKLNKFLLNNIPIKEERDVVYLLVEIRKIMEHENESRYELLRFFCDWAIHTKKERQMKGITAIVEKIDSLVSTVDKITSHQHEQILKFLEMEELRKELLQFLSNHSLPITLCNVGCNWSIFVDTLAQVLSEQPIIDPIVSIRSIEIVSNSSSSQININFGEGRGSTTSGFGK